jgi:hypothetical protein
MSLGHGSVLGFWGRKIGLQEWIPAYIIKKPWFCTKVASVKNSALNTFYKKPIDNVSKICASLFQNRHEKYMTAPGQ